MAEMTGATSPHDYVAQGGWDPVGLYIKGTTWRSQLPEAPAGRARGVVLSRSEVRLGRMSDNDVVLEDAGISRRHAVLRWMANGTGSVWTIEDSGSTGGTWVEDRPVIGPTTVTFGEVIRLGSAELMIWPLIVTPQVEPARPGVPESQALPPPGTSTPLPVLVPYTPDTPAIAPDAPPDVRPGLAPSPISVAPASPSARWDPAAAFRSAKRKPLAAAALAVLLLAVLVPAGLVAWRAFTQVQLSGTITGERFSPSDGQVSLAGIPATITCNGASTTASRSGSYHLALAPAARYTCAVSSSAAYASEQVSISDPARRSLRVDFGPQYAPAACGPGSASQSMVCPALRFRPASLNGKVTWSEWGVPATNTDVACWSFADARAHGGLPNHVFLATTDASGAYSLGNVAPGQYGCVAGADYRLRTVLVVPGVASTLALPICSDHCPPVSLSQAFKTMNQYPYLHPAVMHTFTAYLVFWLPYGQHFEPSGSDERYEKLMAQYFQDIGGTAYYNIVTQYWDYTGPAQNQVTLGDTYADTSAYPHAGTQDDPLWDQDIQAAVSRAVSARNWNIDENSEVFVFTGAKIVECSAPGAGKICAFKDFGGYHSVFRPATAANPMAWTRYAYIPDYGLSLTDSGIAPANSPSPTDDSMADLTLVVVSHEHFETVTDPVLSMGWFDPDPSLKEGGEIGDKCESDVTDYQPIRADGSTVTLNHGHSYFLQKEWSNAANGCAFS